MASVPDPAGGLVRGVRAAASHSGALDRCFDRKRRTLNVTNMEPGADGTPNDVLIVEDDPIIALDCEDTILSFGVKNVRSAGNVARALVMIAERPPDFALLDVSLISEKSFAVAERLEA